MFRAVLIAASLVVAAPAFACSVVETYRVPTNLELAGKAPLIMLGKVEGGVEMTAESGRDVRIRVNPIAVLKGEMPAGSIELEGLSLAPERFAVLSNPYELEGAHPLSYIGGCIRYMFPTGTTALFFLEQREGKWMSAGGPFSRWAEDVLDPQAPWPTLVALYVRAAALREGERKALLEAERAKLAAKAGDPVAHLMALDIARQLAGPNKPWNQLMGEMAGPSGSDQEAAADAAADSVMRALEVQNKKTKRKKR